MYQAIVNQSVCIPFEKEMLLSEILRQAEVSFAMPCGGQGRCGNCKVRATGALSPLSDKEEKLLTSQELAKGIRLACCAKAVGNITIDINRLNIVVNTDFYADIPKNTNGIVIDVGTTTVAAMCWTNGTSALLASEPNAQAAYGSDVISRIGYDTSHPGELSGVLQHQIQSILKNSPEKNIVITANTAMLHFLTGQPTESLGKAPYQPLDFFGTSYPLFQKQCYLPPCISSFVGADITCGILACEMHQKKETSMLIDLGTNGEIVYYDTNTYTVTSTAAGPAFEGAGITMGMPATSGAINHLSIQNGEIHYTTIHNMKAKGICGSGLIDAIAVFLELGVLDISGSLEENHPLCQTTDNGELCVKIPNSDVFLTASDIRHLQLAKAAIHAGILTLSDKADTLYLAGGLGNDINYANAIRIGLLPANFFKKIIPVGNSALAGGAMLLSEENRQSLSLLIENCHQVELASNPVFTEHYINQMFF